MLPKCKSNGSKLGIIFFQIRTIHFCIEVHTLQRVFMWIVSLWRDLMSSPVGHRLQKSITLYLPGRLSSEVPETLSGQLWCLGLWAPLSICLLCVSVLVIHPAPAYNGNIDWPLTRPGQTDFAVIMHKRSQWRSISFQIFLHIVNIGFHKCDWVPNGLQS